MMLVNFCIVVWGELFQNLTESYPQANFPEKYSNCPSKLEASLLWCNNSSCLPVLGMRSCEFSLWIVGLFTDCFNSSSMKVALIR